MAFALISSPVSSQVSEQEIGLLKKLDSVQQSNSPAKYFAALYFETTVMAAEFFEYDEPDIKSFIQRLERRFADYFFHAVDAYGNGKPVPAEWKAYYSDTLLSFFQYQLLGINAHINGDIWQALTAEFTLEELKAHRKTYLDFQKGLLKIYRRFYESSVNNHPATRMLQSATFGLDKIYGRMMLGRWRKRQMNLAVLYHTDPDNFQKKLDKLHRKMGRLNNLVLRHL
jgi:Family of unknown function (DUF5995)